MGIKEHNQNIEKKLEHLDGLIKEKNRLYDELKESMAILLLWPDVFKHGNVRAIIEGNTISPGKMRLMIANEKEEKRFPLVDVPPVLLERHLPNFHELEVKRIRNYLARARKQKPENQE